MFVIAKMCEFPDVFHYFSLPGFGLLFFFDFFFFFFFFPLCRLSVFFFFFFSVCRSILLLNKSVFAPQTFFFVKTFREAATSSVVEVVD